VKKVQKIIQAHTWYRLHFHVPLPNE